MNYLKTYNTLCLRGQTSRDLQYTECHHIIPKCMGGENTAENLTYFTAKEHYLAHYLLTKIYPTNSKILHAFGRMIGNNKFQNRLYNSSQYDKMKLSHSIAMKLNNPMFDEATRNKVAQTKKERIQSGEIIPRVVSDQEKKDISERMTGDNNPTRKYPEKHNFKNNKYVLGKVCYNNGVVNKYFKPDDLIPEEFVKGNKPYKRIRNGVESNHG